MQDNRDISQLRTGLDSIDQEIIRLLEQRLELSRAVADYKRARGIPVLDAAREEHVLEDRMLRLQEENLRPYVREIFIQIMAMSRAEQEKMMEEKENV